MYDLFVAILIGALRSLQIDNSTATHGCTPTVPTSFHSSETCRVWREPLPVNPVRPLIIRL